MHRQRFILAAVHWLSGSSMGDGETCPPYPKGQQNRPFSYSRKESGSNDILLHSVEFLNMHNTDRSSNATLSNLAYKNV